MKIFIGCDHRGVDLKKQIIEKLALENEVIDTVLENYDTDDYPDFAFEVGENVVKNNALGILICGTGVGISIAGNKVRGVRCARVNTVMDAKLSREHNDANIIAIGSDIDINTAIEIITTFIKTTPSNEERHKNRVEKIIKYEAGAYNEL